MTDSAIGIERRALDVGAILQLITDMHSDVKELDKRLLQHMDDETKTLAKEVAELMGKAFPEGDPDGHRRHHELVIAKAEKQAAFWDRMLFELCRWGLIGFVGWAVIAVWKAFLQGPH
jgi:hypothetical protein